MRTTYNKTPSRVYQDSEVDSLKVGRYDLTNNMILDNFPDFVSINPNLIN